MRKNSWNDWYRYEEKNYSCPESVIEERANEFDSNILKTLVQLEKHLRSYGWDKVRFEKGAVTTGRQGEFSQPVTLKLQVRGGSKLTQVRNPIVMDRGHSVVINMTALASMFSGKTTIDVPAPYGEKQMKVEVDCPSSELTVFEIEKASFGWNTRKRWPIKNLKTFAGILTDVFLRTLGHSRRASASVVSDRFFEKNASGLTWKSVATQRGYRKSEHRIITTYIKQMNSYGSYAKSSLRDTIKDWENFTAGEHAVPSSLKRTYQNYLREGIRPHVVLADLKNMYRQL